MMISQSCAKCQCHYYVYDMCHSLFGILGAILFYIAFCWSDIVGRFVYVLCFYVMTPQYVRFW